MCADKETLEMARQRKCGDMLTTVLSPRMYGEQVMRPDPKTRTKRVVDAEKEKGIYAAPIPGW